MLIQRKSTMRLPWVTFLFPVLSGCCIFYPASPPTSQLTVTIRLQQDSCSSRTPKQSLEIVIANNSNQTIAILGRGWISTGIFHEWQAIVSYNDTLRMIASGDFFDKRRLPNSRDYRIVEPDSTYKFTYEFDLSRLLGSLRNSTNTMYGWYSVALTYHDDFPNNCRAVKGTLISNKQRFTYVSD